MGGRGTVGPKGNSMTFEEAEHLWTSMRMPTEKSQREKVDKILSDFIDSGSGYDGSMYRGVEANIPGFDTMSMGEQQWAIREYFKMGKTLKSGAVNESNQKFVSWSADAFWAYHYGQYKGSNIILVNDYGVKGGRALPATFTKQKGIGEGMQEVLTHSNIRYEVGAIDYKKVPGTNEKAFFVHVWPIEKKRKK